MVPASVSGSDALPISLKAVNREPRTEGQAAVEEREIIVLFRPAKDHLPGSAQNL